jgi:hypothetical protein
MSDVVEKLAASLSDAQKEALRQTDEWSGDIRGSAVLASLIDLGLLSTSVVTRDGIAIYGAHHTPLGNEVGFYLQSLEATNVSK